MKILVIGAGALGGYFGARLAEVGGDVTFLLREKRAQLVKQQGIIVRSPVGDCEIRNPQVITRETLSTPFDVILVGCKAYDLQDTMDAFAPAVGPDTMIVPMLNGMSHIDTLCARFGADRVLGGYVMISAALNETGEIVHYNDSAILFFGERAGGSSARVDALAATFEKANCTIVTSTRITDEMWEKWLRIATLAGMTCLMRGSIGDIVQSGGGPFASALFEECLAIALANGAQPSEKSSDLTRKSITDPNSKMTASMFKDLERGGQVEAQQLIGDLINLRPAAAPNAMSGAASVPLLDVVNVHLRTYQRRFGMS